MPKRHEYIEQIKLQLDQLSTQITKLETLEKSARQDALDKYDEELAKLKQQYKVAVSKLEALQASAGDSWDKAVAEMEKVRDAVVHSFNYFKSQV